jgi:protein-disulfide isomerase
MENVQITLRLSLPQALASALFQQAKSSSTISPLKEWVKTELERLHQSGLSIPERIIKRLAARNPSSGTGALLDIDVSEEIANWLQHSSEVALWVIQNFVVSQPGGSEADGGIQSETSFRRLAKARGTWFFGGMVAGMLALLVYGDAVQPVVQGKLATLNPANQQLATSTAAMPPTGVLTQPAALPPTTNQSVANTTDDGLVAQDTIATLKKMADNGFAINTGNTSAARTLYVFTDPNCDACHVFEPTLRDARIQSKFRIVLLPVPERAGSDVKVRAIMCNSSPLQAWQDAMDGKPIPQGEACQKGEQTLRLMSAAAAGIKLRATPALLLDNGRLAYGAQTPDNLIEWANAR